MFVNVVCFACVASLVAGHTQPQRIPLLTPVLPEICEESGGRCIPTGDCAGPHGDLDHFCAETDVCCKRIPLLTPVVPEICEESGGRCIPTGDCAGTHGELDHFCAETDVCCTDGGVDEQSSRCGSRGGSCTETKNCGRAPRDINGDCGQGRVCCIWLF